jgi:DHA2 family multidrug resistance protein-like MFS transporter
MNATAVARVASVAPPRQGLILVALIMGAGVANMNLAVANVGLPDIGRDLDASQTGLNLVAVGFSLGLAASVLYLGALGDRYGRKMMLIFGLALGIPAAFLSAVSPTIELLAFSRLLGGLAAGMAYPTTLALITALWAGASRVRAIALWSALGAAMSSLSPLLAGAILLKFAWGWSFLIAVPFAIVALVMVGRFVPGHVNETKERVDHLGGVLSAIFIGALVLGINYVALPDQLDRAITLLVVSAIAGVAFFVRQRLARSPLFDLRYAARPTFWVAAVSGIIVFGSLMGAMYIGQQFLQNVLGYNALEAGSSILPCAIFMVVAAPFSSRLVENFGSRITLLLGFAFCTLGFVSMYFLWDVTTPVGYIFLSYALIGLGVGIAGTPASHALTDSVPVTKVGMASGTGDLQRDLGGSIMQSMLGAILGAGYAGAIATSRAAAPASEKAAITTDVAATLAKSFGSAEDLAQKYPDYATAIVAAAKQSFLDGADGAYLAGIITMLVGVILVIFCFPRRDRERRLYAEYAASAAAERDALAPTP